jgi:hypothetical protein
VVSEERLKAAMLKVAGFIDEAPELLPVFERLERDLADMQARTDALTRARALVAGQTTVRQNGASQKEIGLSRAAA